MNISSINNQPNFKAVWSKQTLETAKKVGKKTGVDVVGKLNDMLDSKKSLKEFGGDKIELSIGCKGNPSDPDYFQHPRYGYWVSIPQELACKATVDVPGTGKITVDLYNPGYPGEYFSRPHSFEGKMSEEEILKWIFNDQNRLDREIFNSLNYYRVTDDLRKQLYGAVERKTIDKITAEQQIQTQKEIETKVPKAVSKLYEWLNAR